MLFDRQTLYLALTLGAEQALAFPFRGPPVENFSVEHPAGPPASAFLDTIAEANRGHPLQDGYSPLPRPSSPGHHPIVAEPEISTVSPPTPARSASPIDLPRAASSQSSDLTAEQPLHTSASSSCTHAQSGSCKQNQDHSPHPGNVRHVAPTAGNDRAHANMVTCPQDSQCSVGQNHVPQPGRYPPGSNRVSNGNPPHSSQASCPHAIATSCAARPNHVPQPGKYPVGSNRVANGQQQQACPKARATNCGAQPDHTPHPGMIKVGEKWVKYNRHAVSPYNSIDSFVNSVVDDFTSYFGPLTTSVSGATATTQPTPSNAFDVLLSALPDSLQSEFEHATSSFAVAPTPAAHSSSGIGQSPQSTPQSSTGSPNIQPSSTDRLSTSKPTTQPSNTAHPGSESPNTNTQPMNTEHPSTREPGNEQPTNTQQPGEHHPTGQQTGAHHSTGQQTGEHPGGNHQPTQELPNTDGGAQTGAPTGVSGIQGQPTTGAAQVDNSRASIGAHPISNASVAGIASGLCAGAVVVALGAFYLHRRRQQGKPVLGRWGSQKSTGSGPYPQVAWLYDPKMSPPGSPGHSRSGSGEGATLIGNEAASSRQMESGMASPRLAPIRPSSPLLAPLHMPPSREQSPEGRRSRYALSRSGSRSRSTDRLRVNDD